MSEPLPAREVGQGCVIALGLGMLAATPLVFFLGLEFLPRHGDGMGVIRDAMILSVAMALLGLAVAVTAIVVTPTGERGPRSPGDQDDPRPPPVKGDHDP